MQLAIFPTLTDADVRRAECFAIRKHFGQVRKFDGKTSFVRHPLLVSRLVREYSGLSGQALRLAIVVAVLHDTLEDTDTTLQELAVEFGSFVAICVAALSVDEAIVCPPGSRMPQVVDKVWRVRSLCTDILQHVVIADRLANLSEIPASWRARPRKLQQYTQEEPAYMLRTLDLGNSTLGGMLSARMLELRKQYGLRAPKP